MVHALRLRVSPSYPPVGILYLNLLLFCSNSHLEISLRIWEFMLPSPRVVQDKSFISQASISSLTQLVWDTYKKSNYKRTNKGFKYTFLDSKEKVTIPITLHVCAESRYETLRRYTLIGSQYMDFERDTLWIPVTLAQYIQYPFLVQQKSLPYIKSH